MSQFSCGTGVPPAGLDDVGAKNPPAGRRRHQKPAFKCWSEVTLNLQQKARPGGGIPGHASCQREETFAPALWGEWVLAVAQVVRAAKNRTDKARALRYPPRMPQPRVSAVHHFLAGKIKQYGCDLNGRIQG